MTRAWDDLRAAHAWDLPARYNIAQACCDRWQADRLALITPTRDWRHGELSVLSNRLGNALAALGVARGDRVALLLPQGVEALLTHLACYKLGAIVVPLFTLFGPEALEFRLGDSGAKLLVTDSANAAKLDGARDRLPDLAALLLTDTPDGFWAVIERGRDALTPVETGPEDPAFISYTSGTTGPPKGALHAHRVLLGHLPGVTMTHEFPPQPGDRMWTPADWAWMGGLCNIALPCLALGLPLVAHRFERFDPDEAAAFLTRHAIRNVFLPPTALKLMRAAGLTGVPGLRTVGSGGESLGAEMVDWGRSVFGLTINEFYGQTECNLGLGNCAAILPVRPGSTGRAIPGTDVAILGADGAPLPPGTPGEIAMRGSAALFLGYWNQPAKTAAKFAGPWMRTGDEGLMDPDGYVWFDSRSDDVITSSGYRIGPTEIEHCLTGHAAVAMAGVVGVPDPLRTEVVRAYVVPAPGQTPGPALEAALIAHVRARLSPHLAPRSVVFLDALPITATGKILRRDLRALALQDAAPRPI